MQLTISGQQIDLTDSMKAYIGEKMSRIERHFDHLNSIDVVLQVEKIHHKAEATVNAKGITCLLYTSPSPRDLSTSRMPSSA